MSLASILEAGMIICFGISWPLNVARAYRSRTAAGKSVLFDYFILIGYLCGLTCKFIKKDFGLAFYFYWPNLIMVLADTVLYYRNKRLDEQAARAE